jgi:hypothetical protein
MTDQAFEQIAIGLVEAMGELKLCPFCGSKVELQSANTLSNQLMVFACETGSICRGSGLGIYILKDKISEAIDVWNTRAPYVIEGTK